MSCPNCLCAACRTERSNTILGLVTCAACGTALYPPKYAHVCTKLYVYVDPFPSAPTTASPPLPKLQT